MCCNCIQNSSKHKAGKSLPLAPHFSPFTVKRKICNKFRIQIDEDLGFWGFEPGLSSYICNAVWARAAVMKIDWNWFRVLASSIFSSFCPQLWHWRCRKQLQHETFLWKLFQTINFIPLCPPNVQGESPYTIWVWVVTCCSAAHWPSPPVWRRADSWVGLPYFVSLLNLFEGEIVTKLCWPGLGRVT